MSAKRYTGKVVSNKMIGTVVVSVELPKRHSIYKKLMRNTKRIKAHVESHVNLGSMVEILETKPFSKHVSYKVTGVAKE